ncbi:Sodium transporter HKT1 [Acorus calamus]|uniref:Sodium transporter HKT1 n=1 Tax=Acorus calamus TaxID=4465 RepID=A0AAV9EV56_ACOCL|nr:Sodium transporter HKT1 [Acorus calamus]
MSLSLLGFLLLKAFPQRKPSHNFDIFFTSVSASTVSSMSVIEMESFSNLQLLVMTLLMFLGGEIFTSLLVLLKEKLRLRNKDSDESPSVTNQIKSTQTTTTTTTIEDLEMESPKKDDNGMRYSCITYLTKVITGYLLLVHVIGSSLILLYLRLFNMNVLEKKHVSVMVFSIFTTVSSFTNCGYIPTNENMIPFKTNPGLLMLIIPLILGGNTLFPAILRVILRGLKKLPMNKRVVEVDKILEDDHECNIGYDHLLTYQRCVFLLRTVVGFIVVQLIFFCCMEWGSEVLKDLNSYQKIVTALFLAVNARHAGESTVDLSLLPHAILVLYLPPYTTFIPISADNESQSQGSNEMKNRRGVLMESLIFSPLSYLVISIILICVTERKHLVEDPLNFNVLNIVVEVISAYGNVGFSTGYSCERQLKKDGECVDKWYGFSGRWSYKGKVILIFVMFFGRLKKFSLRGGKAWKLD